MRPRTRCRLALAVCVLPLPACGLEAPGPETPAAPSAKYPDSTEGLKPKPIPVRDEIRFVEVGAMMTDHLQGFDHLERYEYDEAAQAFREVRERAPSWILAMANPPQSRAARKTTGRRWPWPPRTCLRSPAYRLLSRPGTTPTPCSAARPLTRRWPRSTSTTTATSTSPPTARRCAPC
jgi:hypothetical protein